MKTNDCIRAEEIRVIQLPNPESVRFCSSSSIPLRNRLSVRMAKQSIWADDTAVVRENCTDGDQSERLEVGRFPEARSTADREVIGGTVVHNRRLPRQILSAEVG